MLVVWSARANGYPSLHRNIEDGETKGGDLLVYYVLTEIYTIPSTLSAGDVMSQP